MSYIGNSPGVASQRIVTTLLATAGQTSFAPSTGYYRGYIDVTLNGVVLTEGDDFTATDGVNVVLTVAAAAGDTVRLVAYKPTSGFVDGYLKAEADARFLQLSGGAVTGPVSLTSASTNSTFLSLTNTATGGRSFSIFSSGSGPSAAGTFGVYDNTAAAVRMLLDASGSLGIGTASPSAKLDVRGGSMLLDAYGAGAGNGIFFRAGFLNTDQPSITVKDHSGSAPDGLYIAAADGISFGTNSSERMRLDSAGNLGIGVTPSGWGSGFTGFDLGQNSRISGNSSMGIMNNAYYNGSSYVYKNNAAAAAYFISNSGVHSWNYAAANTGNITFTQAMTLDASGSLDIGYTGAYGVTGGGATKLTVGWDQNARSQIAVSNQNAGSSASAAIVLGAYGADWIIGTGSVANNNTSLTFTRATSEFARIDSSGNLLVGTTTGANARIRIDYSGQSYGLRVGTTAASGTAIQFVYEPSTQVGTITTTTTSTAYNTSSDYRLKHDIAPMTGALERVAALKPVTYKWNADNSDGEGFIAHELAEVCPHAVTGEKDAVDSEGKPLYQGIDTSFLVATLTAAIQELKAIVDSQAARIATLEAA